MCYFYFSVPYINGNTYKKIKNKSLRVPSLLYLYTITYYSFFACLYRSTKKKNIFSSLSIRVYNSDQSVTHGRKYYTKRKSHNFHTYPRYGATHTEIL